MTIWKLAKDKAALTRLQDEAYHAAAVEEIVSGTRRDGLCSYSAPSAWRRLKALGDQG